MGWTSLCHSRHSAALTRMIAPLLAFTSQEIWTAMPHSDKDDAECVLFNDIPDWSAELALSEEQADKWNCVIALRDDVNKALELARSEQGIKKNQDADLTLSFTADAWKTFSAMGLSNADLATICIVSARASMQEIMSS